MPKFLWCRSSTSKHLESNCWRKTLDANMSLPCLHGLSVLPQACDSFFDGCNQCIIKSESAGSVRADYLVCQAKGEGLFLPESMVTKEEHAIPWNALGLLHVKRLLGCWIVRAKVHTSEASEALKTSSRSLIAVADVAFINRTPNQFKQLSSSKISWCVGETWFSPCHLSQLQSPESLMLPLFLSWLS